MSNDIDKRFKICLFQLFQEWLDLVDKITSSLSDLAFVPKVADRKNELENIIRSIKSRIDGIDTGRIDAIKDDQTEDHPTKFSPFGLVDVW